MPRRFNDWIERHEWWWVGGVALGIITVGLAFWIPQPDPSVQAAIATADATAMVSWFAIVAAWHARRQLDANSRTIEELQKQRYLQSQPWVFPEVDPSDIDIPGFERKEFDLYFRNVGHGPAFNLQPKICEGAKGLVLSKQWVQNGNLPGGALGPKWASVLPGDANEWKHSYDFPSPGSGSIVITYHDIYGRQFLSGYEYRVEGKDNNRELILGDPIIPVERPSFGGVWETNC